MRNSSVWDRPRTGFYQYGEKIPDPDWRSWVAIAAFVFMLVGMYTVGDYGLRQVETYRAEQCVKHSDGTDESVESCYTDRGLALPE